MFDLTIKERVQNGIKALDSKFPNGWAESINLDKLDMNSCTKCIMGQLFSDFYAIDSCKVWENDYKNAYELGFYSDHATYTPTITLYALGHILAKDCKALTEEWTKQINLILGK